MMIRLAAVALLCLLSFALAAPTRPFPAVPRSSEDWWRSAPALAIAPGRLSLAWDVKRLCVHVSDVPPTARVTLDGWFSAGIVEGKPTLTRNGKAMTDVVFTADSGEWNIEAPWSALGIDATSGLFLPVHIVWNAGGGDKQLPAEVLSYNPLTWGVVQLSAESGPEGCPPTLTKPFVYRFDISPYGGRPSMVIEPEPVAGLCLPVEVTFQTVSNETTDVQTRRTPGGPARFLVPAVKTPFAGAKLIAPGYAGEAGTAEYHSLAPGRKTAEFKGDPNWTVPADFDAFWSRAKAELDAVPQNAKVTEVPNRATKTGRLFRVDLDSIGGVRFSGWFFVPRDAFHEDGSVAKRYPAVQVMPGYGAEEPPLDRTASGYITFSVNPRGHGPSADFWPLPDNHLTYNIEDAEKYYYRGAYMDCVRAIQFLQSRPEVDTKRIGVEGGSQGGAFALASAALAPGVAACCANVPFLSDFPTSIHTCTRGGIPGFRGVFDGSAPNADAIRRTLSYIDVRHLATRIHVPTLICVGEMDRTCPPNGGSADFNCLPTATPKRLLLVPGRDHEVPNEMREAGADWFRRHM